MRGLRIALGLIVTVGGVILLPAPGPRMLVVAVGLALLAHESLTMAKLLDAAELRVRPWLQRLQRKWRKRRDS